MRYLGGKTRNAKAIAEVLQKYRKGRTYLEPFCGGLSVTVRMDGDIILNDLHDGLINLYKAIQKDEFDYPIDLISQEEYKKLKKENDLSNPLTTFVGHGLSYAGKWWGGYDTYYLKRGKPNAVQNMTINSLKKKFSLSHIKNALFTCESYDKLEPDNMLIYCDPPYKGTTMDYISNQFDSDQFWDTMRKWSKNNTVIISEFNAPSDFKCIWEKPYKVQMSKEQKLVTEKLFKL